MSSKRIFGYIYIINLAHHEIFFIILSYTFILWSAYTSFFKLFLYCLLCFSLYFYSAFSFYLLCVVHNVPFFTCAQYPLNISNLSYHLFKYFHLNLYSMFSLYLCCISLLYFCSMSSIILHLTLYFCSMSSLILHLTSILLLYVPLYTFNLWFWITIG